jgi:hypothetical protein
MNIVFIKKDYIDSLEQKLQPYRQWGTTQAFRKNLHHSSSSPSSEQYYSKGE